jgi:hypothetical protein
MNDSYKSNMFLNLDGVPYLLGEYIDNSQIKQLDRSSVVNEINVSHKDAMRAVVDIQVDDIGRTSDGYLNAVGNIKKTEQLLTAIQLTAEKMKHTFRVIKSGIIVRINYRLEDSTAHIIRSANEDLFIRDRSFYLDINPVTINDNSIVVNFMDAMVSTISQFTHGTDKLIIRILSMDLFYQSIRRDHYMKPYSENELYDLHTSRNHDININSQSYNCGCDNIYPSGWSRVNKLYHFDDFGQNIVLHMQEVYDPKNKILMIPCGNVIINRSFMINPGHRIIFRISIWKNDAVIVGDTSNIARILGVEPCCPQPPQYPHHPHPPIYPGYPIYPPITPPGCGPYDPNYNHLAKALKENAQFDIHQAHEIHQLKDQVQDINNIMPNSALTEDEILAIIYGA